MSATTIRLWFIRQTDKARLYCRFAPHPDLGFENADEWDKIWIPLSIIEHTSKRGNEHHIKVPDWFIEKSRL
jgi:hypothetical protein